jgi:hypothetical protein
MIEVLRAVGSALPLAAAVVSLLGGIAALRVIRRPEFQARRDRRAATIITLGIAALVGGPVAVLTAMIGSAWSGGHWVAALPITALVFGLPAAAVVAGSSLAGFALLGRRGTGSNATAGAVLGPVALGLLCLLGVAAVSTADSMAVAASIEEERQQVAANSEGLHLSIDDVMTDLDEAGNVASVRLRLTIRSDRDLEIEQLPGKLVYPIFVLSKGGNENTEIQVEAPPGSPSKLVAGSATTYDLTFDSSTAGTPERAAPGDWDIEVRIGGADGVRYGLRAQVTLAKT